jgi:hypothetical protein
MADGLLSSILGAVDRQKQATKAGLGLLVNDPMEFARNATARYFPTPEEVAQQRAIEQAGGDTFNTPYMQKMFNLAQFQGSIKPTGLLQQTNKVIANPQETMNYRGTHTAPSPEFGAPLYDLTGGGQMYPADVYSSKAVQYYGTGYPRADKEAFALANRVRGNPEAEVIMYRAVPKNKEITSINAGDWVSLSKDYAKTHGESALKGNYKILEQKVKAKDLWTNADSIHEFGYHPSK